VEWSAILIGGKGAYACSRRVHARTLVHILMLVGPGFVLVAMLAFLDARGKMGSQVKTVAVIDAAAAISSGDRVDCETELINVHSLLNGCGAIDALTLARTTSL
jgi:hypothetical protein